MKLDGVGRRWPWGGLCYGVAGSMGMTPDKGQKDAGQSCIGWKDMTLPWVSDKLYMATSMSFLDPAALLANKSEAIHVIKLVGS